MDVFYAENAIILPSELLKWRGERILIVDYLWKSRNLKAVL